MGVVEEEVTPGRPPELRGRARLPEISKRLNGLWERIRSPVSELFQIEFEEGRLRLKGLPPIPQWLSALGLTTIALLLISIIFLKILEHGSVEAVQTASGVVAVRNGTIGVTIVILAIGWGLIIRAFASATNILRIGGGVLFFLINGVLVGGLFTVQHQGAVVTAFYNVAKVSLFGVPVALVLLSIRPLADGRPGRWVSSLARVAAPALAVLVFVSLLCAEGAGTSPVRGELASSVLFVLSTLILFLAPLLYMGGMAVLSLTYAIGTAATQTAATFGRRFAWALVIALIGAEAWFFGWRDRADLWPNPDGWIVLLHVLPVIGGFVAIGFIARETLRSKSEAVHGSGAASVALIVAIPSVIGGLYVAFNSASQLGFLHVPAAVSSGIGTSLEHVLSAAVATGPRCVLFGAAAALAITALLHPGVAPRRRQLAIGVALMSFWIFWTVFIFWLPSTDTADTSLLSLSSLVLVAAYLVVKWRRAEPVNLGAVVGLLCVIWLFDPTQSFLHAIGHLSALEGALVLAAGMVLLLAGKSHFAAGAGRNLARESRVMLWIGYLIITLTIAYCERAIAGLPGVSQSYGFRLLTYIAVPYMVWMVMSGRFTTPLITSPDVEAVDEGRSDPPQVGPAAAAMVGRTPGPEDDVPAPNRRRWRSFAIAALSAAVLAGCASAAYAIDRAVIPQPVGIDRGVSVVVPSEWTLVPLTGAAVLQRRGPSAVFVVFVRSSDARTAAAALTYFLGHQVFLTDPRLTQIELFAPGAGLNFATVAEVSFTALSSGSPVFGKAFAFINQQKHLVAEGAAYAPNHRDYHSVGYQFQSIENSLENPSPPFW